MDDLTYRSKLHLLLRSQLQRLQRTLGAITSVCCGRAVILGQLNYWLCRI